jgi:hypothetical protein
MPDNPITEVDFCARNDPQIVGGVIQKMSIDRESRVATTSRATLASLNIHICFSAMFFCPKMPISATIAVLGGLIRDTSRGLNLLAILILANVSCSRDNRSVGEVAQEARATQVSSLKCATVFTNDDIARGRSQTEAGKLSPDKQAFCDELRQRKDPEVEQGYVLMSIDMGSEMGKPYVSLR